MSDIVAIVPIKPLHEAKSRLAPTLGPAERSALVVSMLRGVLHTLAASGVVSERLVVSPDPAALAIAREAGATTLLQPHDGLNPALELARATVDPMAALLAIPADLPWLTSREVADLVSLSRDAPIVIAPDRAQSGTNALFLSPHARLPFAFGPHSFRRHLAAAAAAGLSTQVFLAPGLALDLDTIDDLALLRGGRECIGVSSPALPVAVDSCR